MAADGSSNVDIGIWLFVSQRTALVDGLEEGRSA
jgi:hypothetical protein